MQSEDKSSHESGELKRSFDLELQDFQISERVQCGKLHILSTDTAVFGCKVFRSIT